MENPASIPSDVLTGPQIVESGQSTESARKAQEIPSDIMRQGIARLISRVQEMDGFIGLSFSEFINRLPHFERAAQTLAQSLLSVAYSLLRKGGETAPKSSYEIIICCEKQGYLPYTLIKPLASFLLMVDNGFDTLGSDDIVRIQKDLPQMKDTLRQFTEILKKAILEEKP